MDNKVEYLMHAIPSKHHFRNRIFLTKLDYFYTITSYIFNTPNTHFNPLQNHIQSQIQALELA